MGSSDPEWNRIMTQCPARTSNQPKPTMFASDMLQTIEDPVQTIQDPVQTNQDPVQTNLINLTPN